MKRIVLTFITLAAIALFSGCVSLDEYDRVANHLRNSEEANAALRGALDEADGVLEKLDDRNTWLKEEIESMNRAQAERPDPGEEIRKQLLEMWGDNDWEVIQKGGAVGVRIDDRGVLFKSGSWILTQNTKKTLTKLAAKIKSNMKANTFVRVDGHTDADPVKKLRAKGVKDNVHLSALRAHAVREFLVAQGIAKDRIFIAGFGSHWPIKSNKTSIGKRGNRRVEIFLGDADTLSIGGLPADQVSR